MSPAFSSQGRTCCKYRCDQKFENVSTKQCSSWCNSHKSCVLRNEDGPFERAVANCTVQYDSKKDKNVDGIETCLSQGYEGNKRLGSGTSTLQFHVVAYQFIGIDQQNSHFTGIDLRFQYLDVSSLKFRIKDINDKVCPEHEVHGEAPSGVCKPRCVAIKSIPDVKHDDETLLSYDCEAGFYISRGNWISTATHDYLLNVCLDESCGEFLFRLPDLSSETNQDDILLVLIDRKEFTESDKVVVYVPNLHEADVYHLVLVKVGENITKDIVHNQTVSSSRLSNSLLNRIELDFSIPSGRFQLLVTPMKNGKLIGTVLYSGYLTKPDYGQHTLAIITAILVTVLMVGIVLTLYRRWQAVAEAGAVEPGDLILAGRMEEQTVLIVTPLDNPDHVDVVKHLCRYLRDWCGVGTTYFAMDDETGIGSTQRDPWKWCQETGDKVRDKGTIVFIAGPDPGLSTNTSLHPNLEHNQAFLTTRHLHQMAKEGRALVARFSYSSLRTLPQEVPEHLKSSAYLIPKQTNEFLVHLLQVKKRALCNLLPCPIVRPDVKPSDLSRAGGHEMLQKISELAQKESKSKLEKIEDDRKKARRSTSIVKPVVMSGGSGNEEITLLMCEEIKNLNKSDQERTLKVDVEGGMPSIKDMGDRDRMDIEEE